jgi:hypothetical protein
VFATELVDPLVEELLYEADTEVQLTTFRSLPDEVQAAINHELREIRKADYAWEPRRFGRLVSSDSPERRIKLKQLCVDLAVSEAE